MKSWAVPMILILLSASILSIAEADCGWAQGMMGGGCGGMMNDMMGDMLPPMDAAQLPDPDSKGANLLARFCTQCHNLPGPGLHTSGEWPPVVTRMVRRMRMMSGRGMMMGRIEAPSSDQVRAITAYLETQALKPFASERGQELEAPGGSTFSKVCSQCHVLPDPARHSGQEWPAIVDRMTNHMESMGKPVPKKEELHEIVRFLKKHGK